MVRRWKTVSFIALLSGCSSLPQTGVRAPAATAQSAIESYVSNTSSRWEVVCSKNTAIAALDPEIDRHLRDTLVANLIQGLTKIAALNPDLVENRIRNFGSLPLKILCGSKRTKADGIWHKKGLFGTMNSIDLTPYAHAIAEQAAAARTPDAPHSVDLDFRLESGSSVSVHEFLHFLNFDNNSTSVHDHLSDGNPKSQKDVVYACTAQAFFSLAIFRMDEPGYPVYKNTVEACMTCALATPNGNETGTRVSNDKNQGEIARKQCSGANLRRA